MFIILSGSSGVGKNTVIKEMQKTEKNLTLMPTFTTREKREGEVEGQPYFYISKEDFQQKIKDNELIEYEFIHNNFYGSSYKVFDEYIKSGKVLIKDIGVEGAQNLSHKMSDHTEMIKVFLAIPHKSDLKKRLQGRGEKQIKLRLKRFDYEQKQKNKFDFIIVNTNLEQTSDYVKHGKPQPDVFLYAAEKLSVDPANCMVVEDATQGVAAAKAAGMKCIGFNQDNKDTQDLSKADIIVDDMRKINFDKINEFFIR